jgi:hypothetical protein
MATHTWTFAAAPYSGSTGGKEFMRTPRGWLVAVCGVCGQIRSAAFTNGDEDRIDLSGDCNLEEDASADVLNRHIEG